MRRRYMVGAAPVAVTLVGATPWVAAGAPLGVEHRGGTLRVSYSTITELDPAVPFDVHPGIWAATGDGLVGLVETSGAAQLVPDLATGVPQPTDGGRTYSFRLRPGMQYSTGAPVRPSDFLRQLERLFAVHSDIAGYYGALRGAGECRRRPAACDLSAGVVTDDRAGTIVFHLARPDPEFLFKLTLPPTVPVPPGTPRTALVRRPIPSTGPYRVGRFVPGELLLLVRNERFEEWSRAAQPDGYPDRIEIRMDDDPEARVEAVLDGDADLAIEIASADLAELRTRFASQFRPHGQPDTTFLSLNLQAPPFDDVRARQALNLAIDRAALVRRFGGRLSNPTCQPLPPSILGHEDYCPWTRDPQDGRWHGPDVRRARSLVRASGTAGMTVAFVIDPADTTGRLAAGELAAALRRIGYRPRVDIIRGEAVFRRRIGDTQGGWNVGSGEWTADYPAAGQFLDHFLRCSNYHPEDPALSTNSGGFCNPRFDRLVARAEALQITDPAAAEMVWARADRLAVDEAAWVPLANLGSAELVSRRVGHFTLDPNGQPQIDQMWVR